MKPLIRILKIFKQAFSDLMIRKGRTFLTALGIIIGTATIVIVVGIGSGAQADVEDQYSNLSAETIMVMGSRGRGKDATPSKLSAEDATIILEESQYIEYAIPQLSGQSQVSIGSVDSQHSIIGTSDMYSEAFNIDLQLGEFFSASDVENKSKVVVVGSEIAEDLLGSTDVVGETMKINRKNYEIVGVLAYRGSSMGQVSIDDSIFAPYDTVEKYIVGKNGMTMINLQAYKVQDVDAAMEEITEILREEHDLDSDEEDDFMVRDMGSVVENAMSSAETMTWLLGSVAMIVLIVGGIGIMNIMYITVQERTKEIGIRKAVGAKNFHILTQFLSEAFILSVLGSGAGAVIAHFSFDFFEKSEMTVTPTWWGYALAVGSSILVGVFFGFYPAQRASKLKPVDALRYE